MLAPKMSPTGSVWEFFQLLPVSLVVAVVTGKALAAVIWLSYMAVTKGMCQL